MGKTMFQLRAEAQAKGEKTFSRDKSCVRGHAGIYYVASGQCVECAKRNSRQTYQDMKQIIQQWGAQHEK